MVADSGVTTVLLMACSFDGLLTVSVIPADRTFDCEGLSRNIGAVTGYRSFAESGLPPLPAGQQSMQGRVCWKGR